MNLRIVVKKYKLWKHRTFVLLGKREENSRLFWDKSDEDDIALEEDEDDENEKNQSTKRHFKSFSFYQMFLLDHQYTERLVSKIKILRQERGKWNDHFGAENYGGGPQTSSDRFTNDQGLGTVLKI